MDTVEKILNTPITEFISPIIWNRGVCRCRFCGKELVTHPVGNWYKNDPCTCAEYLAAAEHNEQRTTYYNSQVSH